jgi:hypothetical protein
MGDRYVRSKLARQRDRRGCRLLSEDLDGSAGALDGSRSYEGRIMRMLAAQAQVEQLRLWMSGADEGTHVDSDWRVPAPWWMRLAIPLAAFWSPSL